MKFHFGPDEATDLTDAQVLLQCKMYVAALRIADDFGCDAIGIQYQQGLKDLLPASDLVEGMLNNADRPPVTAATASECFSRGAAAALQRSRRMRRPRRPDDQPGSRGAGPAGRRTRCTTCAGDDDRDGNAGLCLGLPDQRARAAGALHRRLDRREQRAAARRCTSGSAATLKGVSRPGQIVWTRIFVEGNPAYGHGTVRRSNCRRKKADRRLHVLDNPNGRSCTPGPTA